MKKRYVITYLIKDGENEYSAELIIEANKEELDKKLDKYFSAFFGNETYKEAGYYCAFMRNVSVKKIQEINKNDFKILKKYLNKL